MDNIKIPSPRILYSTDLCGFELFNTGPIAMAGLGSISKIYNKTIPFKITSVDIWLGAYKDTVADMGATLYRHRGDSTKEVDIMFEVGWDRYANPTNISNYEKKYDPYGFVLTQDDVLELSFVMNNFTTNIFNMVIPKKGQIVVTATGLYLI